MAQSLTSNNIYDILRGYFGPLIPTEIFNHIITIADTSYLTTNRDWLRNLVLYDEVLAADRYKRDIFDCDDYAFYLKTKVSLYAANTSAITKPLAVGCILTRQHAFNFGIEDNNALFLLNTQSTDRGLIIPKSATECANFLGLSNSNQIKIIYI